MFVSESLGVNEKGHLTIAGADAVDLAARFGTPVYVMDEGLIRKNCALFREAFETYYEGRGMTLYASKAFCCKEMCRIAMEEGMGLDVVSLGELWTALSVGFPPERIFFHGNNKSFEELRMAVDREIGGIIVDNLEELKTIEELTEGSSREAKVLLRIKPGIDAHTHDFVRTGQIDSKFGFALETGEALAALLEADSCRGIELKGIHCHIGSQIFELEPFKLAAEVMLGLMAEFKEKTGKELEQLNLGGGFGVRYEPEDDPPAYGRYIRDVSETVRATAERLRIRMPYIMIEPGRAIVGPAGVTLYTVGSVKKIPGIRTYVSVNGGMCDNPRYALYQARHDMVIADRAGEKRDDLVTVAGKCCESGDLLGENVRIQKAAPGDILAVLTTGAYTYSMASRYNRTAIPPVVMVKDGSARLAVKGETLDDLIGNDI